MIASPTHWLILTAAVSLCASLLVLVAMLFGRRSLALVATWAGITGTALGSALVTLLLSSSVNPDESVIDLPVWTWVALTVPLSPSIEFGLNATSTKSGIVSAVCVFSLILLGIEVRQSKSGLSLDAIAATSLLGTGATVLVFAPNLPQALIGWAIGSLSIGILIRLSHSRALTVPGTTPPIRQTDSISMRAFSTSSQATRSPISVDQRLQRLSLLMSAFEQVLLERFWLPLTSGFPDWIGEQLEFLADRPAPIQVFAATIGALAILLTWLIGI